MNKKFIMSSLLITSFLLQFGCQNNIVQPNDPRYAPVLTPVPRSPGIQNGTIFQAGFDQMLWYDRKAHRVGDILTVILQEETSSSKSAQTSITKDSAANMPEPTIFGTLPHMEAGDNLPTSQSTFTMENDYSASREFSGEADADQSNSLSGNITVTVSDVLPNGNLVIRGEKWLTLAKGEEYIRITGLVRPEDITQTNTIASTKIADARIVYSGTGDLSNAQNMGWLTRFFNSPYWPL